MEIKTKHSFKQQKTVVNPKLAPHFSDALYFTFQSSIEFLSTTVSNYKISGTVLDLGCGQKPYRSLFPDYCNYVGVDIDPNSKADHVCNNWELPLKDKSVDCVISTFSLEHTRELHPTIREIERVLKPSGVVILIVPFMFPLHEKPYDYWRFTSFSLEYLFKNFNKRRIIPSCGYIPTTATIINLQILIFIKMKFLQKILFSFNNLIAVLIDYLVRKLLSSKQSKEIQYTKGYYSLPLNYLVILENER